RRQLRSPGAQREPRRARGTRAIRQNAWRPVAPRSGFSAHRNRGGQRIDPGGGARGRPATRVGGRGFAKEGMGRRPCDYPPDSCVRACQDRAKRSATGNSQPGVRPVTWCADGIACGARRAHGAYFTTKPSVPPGLVSRPPPKRFDPRYAPLGEYLARNMSPPPRSGSRPPPKSTAPVKLPVTITLPLPSSATLVAPSSLVPPKLLDHRGAPSGEYSARKM